MNSSTSRSDLISLVQQLKDRGSSMAAHTITAGFDGFIDTVVKIIRSKNERQGVDHFESIGEFGRYVSDHSFSSFSLEVEPVTVKIGGNMPIVAHAFGTLGASVNCIGAFGYPHLHGAFDSLSTHCRRYSFADPGTSTAYEFNDGKMMVGNMGQLNALGWEELKQRIGLQTLQRIFGESDLLCLLNWSEIDATAAIWKGILAEIMTSYYKPDQQLFFDLSDCSKRDDRSVIEMLDQVRLFSTFAKVTLGLNRNEANKILMASGLEITQEPSVAGKKIFEKLNIDGLIIHSNREAFAITRSESSLQKSFFIPNPRISTGAGDHFNAGFNAGRLLGLDLKSCLLLAHGVSGYYVRYASSPSLPQLITFLSEA